MKLSAKIPAATVFSWLALTVFSLTCMADPVTPEGLSPPRITSPVYKGATLVEVQGFRRHAQVHVYNATKSIGGGTCLFSRCPVDVQRIDKIPATLTATQMVDGVLSYPTRNEYAVTVEEIPDFYFVPDSHREQLVSPAIDDPLVDCQRIVPVKNVIPGARVQLFS